jgi:hypothetical protein
MNELWFNQVGEEDEEVIQADSDANQSPQADQAVSGETPTMGDSESLGDGLMNLEQSKASSSSNGLFNRLLPTIAEGGRDFSRYPDGGLPAINNPDSSEFDPNAEGSRDSLGRVRWGSKDWDKYNSNKSSGDSLSRGVTFGGGGGFGGGGQSVSVGSPMPSQAGFGTSKKFPWLLAGGVLVAAGYYFMVYKK